MPRYQRINIDDPTINLRRPRHQRLAAWSAQYSGRANLFGVSAQYRF